MNQNKHQIFSKLNIVKDYGNSINKEFIPIFFIILTPTLSFLEGYGIKTIVTPIKNLYYFIPVLFGLLMNYKDKNKIINLFFFIFLFILSILKNIPILFMERYFNGNFLMLLISDMIIVLYYFFISISFWVNDPYFILYYRSKLKLYKILYKIISLFFAGICVILIIFFVRIYLILKEMS